MSTTGSPRLLPPWLSWAYVAVATSLAVLCTLGIGQDLILTVGIVACGAAIVTGILRNKPTPRWPWWCMSASALLWALASYTRTETNALGDLSSSRSLLSDFFAVPGFITFYMMVYGLIRARRGKKADYSTVTDGVLVALGAVLVGWIFVIEPALRNREAWIVAKVAVTMYMPLSAVMLALTCRLVFDANERNTSYRMLLGGVAFLLIGDVSIAMADLGRISVDNPAGTVPYLMTATLLGAAALHPSMRHVSTARPTTQKLTRGRVAGLIVTMLLPGVVFMVATPDSLGSRIFLGLIISALAFTAGLRLILAVRAQNESEEQVLRQARFDELSGLPNRVYTLEHIAKQLNESEITNAPVGVIYIDLDNFKLINDSMGADVGDELLCAAAARIKNRVRPVDFVARLAADEFAVVTVGLDATEVRSMAERLRVAFSERLSLSVGDLVVSCSVGVALSENGFHSDALGLLRDADTAMYHAKRNGRNAVAVFDTGMRSYIQRRVELERRLRAGLEQGEIGVHYQPLVTLPDGKVAGYEALVRWRHNGEWIQPGEFIPVAEDSGLIVQLGAFVLDEACRQLSVWRKTLPGAENHYVSVNLSPRQIRESDIIDVVEATLKRWDLPGEALWLEITEGVMMEDTLDTASVLNYLRGLGVRFSVDDFGTGFSSLAYLKRYPVSRVKIDKAFIDGLGEDATDESIVAGILAMAEALDLSAIAEGVEQEKQARRLFELGCFHAQGWLFSKALPAEEIPAVVAELGSVSV